MVVSLLDLNAPSPTVEQLLAGGKRHPNVDGNSPSFRGLFALHQAVLVNICEDFRNGGFVVEGVGVHNKGGHGTEQFGAHGLFQGLKARTAVCRYPQGVLEPGPSA